MLPSEALTMPRFRLASVATSSLQARIDWHWSRLAPWCFPVKHDALPTALPILPSGVCCKVACFALPKVSSSTGVHLAVIYLQADDCTLGTQSMFHLVARCAFDRFFECAFARTLRVQATANLQVGIFKSMECSKIIAESRLFVVGRKSSA